VRGGSGCTCSLFTGFACSICAGFAVSLFPLHRFRSDLRGGSSGAGGAALRGRIGRPPGARAGHFGRHCLERGEFSCPNTEFLAGAPCLIQGLWRLAHPPVAALPAKDVEKWVLRCREGCIVEASGCGMLRACAIWLHAEGERCVVGS
jgi:hypothetical protein